MTNFLVGVQEAAAEANESSEEICEPKTSPVVISSLTKTFENQLKMEAQKNEKNEKDLVSTSKKVNENKKTDKNVESDRKKMEKYINKEPTDDISSSPLNKLLKGISGSGSFTAGELKELRGEKKKEEKIT